MLAYAPLAKKLNAAALVLAWVAAVVAAPPAASLHAATPQEVDAAIKKGRAFLLSQQRKEGRWEPDAKRTGTYNTWEKMQGASWGGYSAIATYALLASSDDVSTALQEPRIAKAVQFLKSADMYGAYAVGMRAQVWTFLPDGPEKRKLAERDAQRLVQTINTGGAARGLWDYADTNRVTGPIDHSMSQYGVLGLWACERSNYQIEPQLWELMERVWRDHQYPSGGWSYNGNGKDSIEITPSMTAAGVATLFITQEFVLKNPGINCKEIPANQHIDLGLKWMDQNINAVGANPYAWYGVERIGTASGLKYFGDKDWFATGAEILVRSQGADGSWNGGYPGATPIPTTAFSVLFLSRGRAAVAVNKLQYGHEAIALPTGGAAAAAGAAPPPACCC